MFGYIRPLKDELKVRQYNEYKGVYCSLCRSLKKNFGLPAGLILSYDFTFVAMLGLSLAKGCPGFTDGRCAFNPVKKCLYCSGGEEIFDLVAAVSIILFYYKLKDNIYDGSLFTKPLYAAAELFARIWKNKAKRLFPEVEKRAQLMMTEQRRLEESGAGIDQAAHPTAEMVGYLASLLSEDSSIQEDLSVFGYHMGRWIYFIDAQDDLIKDVKKGNFNPVARRFSLSRENIDNKECILQARKYANGLLNMSLSEAITRYEALDTGCFAPILDNILRMGMPASQMSVFKGREGKDDRKSV